MKQSALKIIILVGLSGFISACAPDMGVVDPRIVPYVSQLETISGLKIDPSISIEITNDLPFATAGRCEWKKYADGKYRIIKISKNRFDYAEQEPLTLLSVLAHEAIHCQYNYGHDTSGIMSTHVQNYDRLGQDQLVSDIKSVLNKVKGPIVVERKLTDCESHEGE